MTAIPDDVIEAMADAYTQGRGVTDAQLDSVTAIDHRMRAALQAAEAMGWKLVPREPTGEMECAIQPGYGPNNEDAWSAPDITWRAMWDSAPSVKP